MKRFSITFLIVFLLLPTLVFCSGCEDILFAIDNFYLEKCAQYIEKANSVECRDKDGFTPLLKAVYKTTLWRKNEEKANIVLQLLKKGADINVSMPTDSSWWDKGDNALHFAAMEGNLEIVKMLVEYGSNKDAQNYYGITPLMKAAEMNRVEIVKYLMHMGADINIKNNEGENVLLYQAKSSGEKYELVKILLDAGLSPNSENLNGRTILMREASWRHLSTVMLLVERGATVNNKDNNGRTSLIYAVWAINPNKNVITFLLENGADPNIFDKEGKSAYFYALENGHFEIANILAKAGADTTPHNKVCKRILKQAMKKGYNPPTDRKNKR